MALAAILAIASRCDLLTDSRVCTLELRSVIQVDVFDSLTETPAAAGTTLLLTARGFTDSVTVPDSVDGSLAQVWYEDRVKAGTYALQVRKPGYRLWTRNDIRLQANSCHVTTFEQLKVLLQR